MYKPLADSTLKAMTKDRIIDYLRCAEHNYNELEKAYRIAVDNSKCHHCPIPRLTEEHDKQIYNKALEDFSKKMKEDISLGLYYIDEIDLEEFMNTVSAKIKEQLMK